MTLSARAQTHLDGAIARLRAEGAAFAIATVVRTVDATSAKPGSRALLDAGGAFLEGWVGSGCARGAVSKAAREAIAAGKPQFLSLRPEDLLKDGGVAAGETRDGVRFARNGCPSKGSMDIFVEPVLPLPRLVICGAGPVAAALAALAGRFDYHRVLCAPGTDRAALPETEGWQDGYALDTDGAANRYVVIATQGRGDEAALRAVLASGARHVSFVGSRRKFAALADRLERDGIGRALLDAVAAPAGLDIGSITPDEIALSILAEIVAVQRRGQRPAAADRNPARSGAG